MIHGAFGDRRQCFALQNNQIQTSIREGYDSQKTNDPRCWYKRSFKVNEPTTLSLTFQTFRRDGNDLFMNHKIGLVEALCGFQFMLKHLDGRQIVVKYPAGKVIEPG